MTNTVNLKEVDPSPNNDLIECIEDILKDAKSGEIISLAYAAELTEGRWQINHSIEHGKSSLINLLGGITLLKTRLCRLCELK